MIDLSRRTALAGTLATLAFPLASAGPASAGEIQMRQILVAILGQRAMRIANGPHALLYRAQVEIARNELAKFDRGEGLWRKLARQYADGIPPGLVPETSIRRFLNASVEVTKRIATERSTPRTRAHHQKAVEELAAFERGDTHWRQQIREPFEI